MNFEQITRETPFADFFEAFDTTYMTETHLGAYLTEKEAAHSYDEVKAFFESPEMRDVLQHFWDYERGETWKTRTVQTAVTETLGHTMASLSGEISILRSSSHGLKGTFDQKSQDEITALHNTVVLLMGYFYTEFRPTSA